MPSKSSKQATHAKARELATKLRSWLDEYENRDVIVITGPMLHRTFGPIAKRHEWELALALMNKTGDMSKPGAPSKVHSKCCADCNAAQYYVRRKSPWAKRDAVRATRYAIR